MLVSVYLYLEDRARQRKFMVYQNYYMQPTTLEIALAQMYSDFNNRDVDGVLTLMHPDVHWPNGWEGGYVKGHEQVREYWSRQWQVLDPIVLPVGIDELEDGRVSVSVQQTVKDNQGKLLGVSTIKHLYTFDKGLIKTMEIE